MADALLGRMPGLTRSLRLTPAESASAAHALAKIFGEVEVEHSEEDVALPDDSELVAAGAPQHADLDDAEEASDAPKDAIASALAAEAEADEAADALDLDEDVAELSAGVLEALTVVADEEDTAAEASEADVWAVEDTRDVSDFTSLVPTPAVSYPFELDAFQKRAVIHLERHEDVFVSAHTSSGKTVVAEYAIALALRQRARAVYTSPVKALSNQKYRELRQRFGDGNVGLLTGDASINPAAPCLIVTTEILRGMLHRDAAEVGEIAWVIFDEVHYIDDIERGVVWEETIISLVSLLCPRPCSRPCPCASLHMSLTRSKRHSPIACARSLHVWRLLPCPAPCTCGGSSLLAPLTRSSLGRLSPEQPPTCRVVCLSATVPNSLECAQWIGATKRRVVHLVSTQKRPTPLRHFIYAAEALYPIVDEAGHFLADGHANAAQALRENAAKSAKGQKSAKGSGGKGSGGKGSGGASAGSSGSAGGYWELLLAFLRRQQLLPAVVFSFSKVKCDEIAASLADGLPGGGSLSEAEEVDAACAFYESCIERLSEEERALPQLVRVLALLKCGIGVHHSGMLPIVRKKPTIPLRSDPTLSPPLSSLPLSRSPTLSLSHSLTLPPSHSPILSDLTLSFSHPHSTPP